MPREYVMADGILVGMRNQRRYVVSISEGVCSGRVILYLWMGISAFELLTSIFMPYSMSSMTSIANYSLHSYDVCVIR